MFSKMRLIVISIFLTWFQCICTFEVSIEQGTLVGGIFSSRNGRQYRGFLGIPFAKPPVGELRFEPPQPPEPWNGLRNATELPPICIQKDAFVLQNEYSKVEGEEDCLYLNVYTPAESTSHLLPVMVWIHGGGFIVGSGNLYSPTYFMDHDVVVVTIQYRLNTLGFLSTADHVLPGNYGMKDQVMALKWIQKNVQAFGGDPNRVTIFGESAGAGSVHLHMYSPLSKGLFHRAISQSGSALASWSYVSSKVARQRAFTIGTLTGCPTTNSQKLADCLKKVPAEELVLACRKLCVWDEDPPVTLRIVSEPSTVQGAFIHENPWHQDEINKVPFIIGFTSGEGVIKAARYLHDDGAKARYLNDHHKRIFPISLFYGEWVESAERISQITESIKKFYFADKDINIETSTALVNLYTDSYFAYDVIESAKRRENTTFFYYYDHRNERSFGDVFGNAGKDLGVCHGDELISLFHVHHFLPKITKGDDLKVSERMIKYWVNFAATGIPDSSNVWTPVESDSIEYLHITTHKDEMKTGVLKERYEFWKSLKITPPKESPTLSSNFADEL